MMAPLASLLPLVRWAWGPLSVPCRLSTPTYRQETKNSGTRYRCISAKVSHSQDRDKK
jgi:hypothetical protein